jgi:hypothetical protein
LEMTCQKNETYKNQKNVEIVTRLNHHIVVKNLAFVVVDMPHTGFGVQFLIGRVFGVLSPVVRQG